MTFSKIARILAVVAIALGLLDIVLAISVANMEPYEAARARYLGRGEDRSRDLHHPLRDSAGYAGRDQFVDPESD